MNKELNYHAAIGCREVIIFFFTLNYVKIELVQYFYITSV